MTAATPRRGLVLGGGGVLGASWMIGALSALEQALGWDPREAEVIIGTSAGSVLAGLLGSGVGAQSLVNHQRGVLAPGDPRIDFDPDTASGGALPPMPRLRIGSRALVARTVLHPRRVPPLAAFAAFAPRGRGSLAPVGDLIRAANPSGAWPAAPEVWVVAMDYDSGRRIAFGRGDAPAATMPEAVMSSCAIPGWYAAVEIDGRRYVDGGTLSPTSIDLLCDRGLDEVYVLAPMASFDYDEPASMVGRMERRFRRAMTKRVLHEAGKVRRRGASVTVLGPGRADLEAIGVNLMDHRRRKQVLEVSLTTTAAALADAGPPLSAAG
ncbi:MAG TPA: patatin-like phospholipase family protein [Mycobacteriales bacterium]|nr:patatin-like phospholipase family protein [Mycobacteriales bacterium]